MLIHQYIDQEINERKEWALRRKLGIPTDKQLLIITCMDERIPIDEALGLSYQDAHVFRNAGGIVTDDTIRSVMLSTHFCNTKEIIIINHTDCGLITLKNSLKDKLIENHIDLQHKPLNPALPELTLHNQEQNFEKWVGLCGNIDDMCLRQIELLKQSPYIPEHVIIHGYIWQVESMSLRRPHEKLSDQTT